MKPHTYNSTKVEWAGTAATFVDVLTCGLIGARVLEGKDRGHAPLLFFVGKMMVLEDGCWSCHLLARGGVWLKHALVKFWKALGPWRSQAGPVISREPKPGSSACRLCVPVRPSSCFDHWEIGLCLCAWCSCACIDYSNSNLFVVRPTRRSKRSSADPFVVLLNKSDRNNPCKPYKDLAW